MKINVIMQLGLIAMEIAMEKLKEEYNRVFGALIPYCSRTQNRRCSLSMVRECVIMIIIRISI